MIIYTKSAFYKGKEIYNAASDLKDLTKREKTDECSVNYEFYYNPLSLVGNYYSFESGEGGIIACGVPSNSLAIKTIDLDTNLAISLSDIFPEESIVKALKSDSWVKTQMDQSKIDLASIHIFDAILDTINSIGYASFKPNSFALLGYDKKTKKALVRLVGEEYMGFNHTKHLQLGLQIDPKKSYRQLLKNKVYFTIDTYNNGLKK